MKPLVSIVIPIYNGEKYIDSCMEGLLNQTYSNLELIVVNDGSKDTSGELCDRYAQKDSRVKVHHQENKGLSAARNAGIQQATGKYVIFFDVDDTVENNIIEDNVVLAEQNQADVVMFCFWYYNVDKNSLKPNGMKRIFVGNAKEYFDKMLIPTMDNEVFNAPWNKLIRRQLLEEHKLRFDDRYPIYEDIIFASELFGVVNKIVINNQMYYRYFVRSSGSLITRFYERFYDSVAQFHQNAMKYCGKYENNARQITRLNTLYTKLVIMHMKQISCNEQLSKERKYQLLQRICNEDEFIEALANSKFGIKKKMMRFIINQKMYKMIYVIYKIRNAFPWA